MEAGTDALMGEYSVEERIGTPHTEGYFHSSARTLAAAARLFLDYRDHYKRDRRIPVINHIDF